MASLLLELIWSLEVSASLSTLDRNQDRRLRRRTFFGIVIGEDVAFGLVESEYIGDKGCEVPNWRPRPASLFRIIGG